MARVVRGGRQAINFAHVHRGLRGSSGLTPEQKCGVLLLTYLQDRVPVSTQLARRDVRRLGSACQEGREQAETVALGIGALTALQTKVTDGLAKKQALKTLLAKTDTVDGKETADISLECVASVVSDSQRLEDDDAKQVVRTLWAMAERFPHLRQRAFEVIGQIKQGVALDEPIFNSMLDLVQSGEVATLDILEKCHLQGETQVETSIKLVKMCLQSPNPVLLRYILSLSMPQNLEASNAWNRQLVQALCDAPSEGLVAVAESLLKSNKVSFSALVDLLSRIEDENLIKHILNSFDVHLVRSSMHLVNPNAIEDMFLTMLDKLQKYQLLDEKLETLMEAGSAAGISRDFWLNWCSHEEIGNDIRLRVLSFILDRMGLETPDDFKKIAELLRTCETRFSEQLVQAWKLYHQWSSTEGIISLSESNSLISRATYVNALVTSLSAKQQESGKLKPMEIELLRMFFNGTTDPHDLNALGHILSFGSEAQPFVYVVLNLIDRNINSDDIVEQGLNTLLKIDPDEKHSADILAAVINVLENRRARRKKATPSQIQKNEWTDYNVYLASKKILDRMPASESVERTDLSKAQRLLLFMPPQGDATKIHNVKPYIAEYAQRDLLSDTHSHPLAALSSIVQSAFPDFTIFGPNLSPVVTTQQCFDDLLTPPDHVSRKPSDTFYFNENTILRPHTSAHQTQFLRAGYEKFLVAGDVYRRDEIDRTHFPVFHQMEGVKVLPEGSTPQDAFEDLQSNLNRVAETLFPGMPRKWIDAYFPFTEPSLELEIDFKGKSIELLGCGVVHKDIMKNCGLENRVAWAFGLGLERLAMVLFEIPDIRLFWSEDPRFLKQFKACKRKFLRSKVTLKYKPFSKFPPMGRDISMWVPNESTFHINDFYSLVREVAGDLVEEVNIMDEYTSEDGRTSKAFRIVFRSDFRTLTRKEVNAMTQDIHNRVISQLGVTIREK